MREAYNRQSDSLGFNKVQLTPRNIRNEVFKFYRWHLHPLKPSPSFKHCLMWALQSQQFTLNWQFDFTHQLNYAAVEANWRLALDASAADNANIVFAAAFAPEKRGTPPGDWHIDHYNGVDFHTVCLSAMDQREDANNAQMEDMLNQERRSTAPIPPDEFDLTNTFDFFDGLYDDSAHASDTEHASDDANGRPPGMQPAYRDEEAMHQAEREEDDEFDSADAPRERNRYVDDEAVCDDDDDDHDDDDDGSSQD